MQDRALPPAQSEDGLTVHLQSTTFLKDTFKNSSFKKSLNQPRPVATPVQPQNALPSASLTRWGTGWLLDCEIRQHSGQTGKLRGMILKNLGWLAAREGWAQISPVEIRAFLAYLSSGHIDPGGRWGNRQMTRPVRPITVHTYHSHLRTFFGWLVTEGILAVSPMATIRPPVARADQVQPFTAAEIEALLAATNKGWRPARDAAMVWLLLDTGIRAGELCGLRRRDLDLTEKRITVTGKGDKTRTVYFGLHCGKALWRYLHWIDAEYAENGSEMEKERPLFFCETGTRRGEPLQPHTLGLMIERLGQRAGVSGVRVSPHTFRHTFAVMFLRSGGQQFSLKEILGHTSLEMTTKYVQFAEADLAGQRRYSPGDKIKGKITPEAARANKPPLIVKPLRTEHTVRRKLSATDARAIKAAALAGEPRKDIAARFGVSVSTVKQIKSGDIWKDL